MTRETSTDLAPMLRVRKPWPAHLRSLPMPVARPALPAPPAVEWPRNAYADWCPQPIPTEPPAATMVALTVFTTFRPPVAPGADPLYAATCVCGDVWHSTSDALMRVQLSEHRCAQQLGHAPGLLPHDTDTGTDVLDRVLDGLRRLS